MEDERVSSLKDQVQQSFMSQEVPCATEPFFDHTRNGAACKGMKAWSDTVHDDSNPSLRHA